MTAATAEHFDQQYQTRLKHPKLKGLQPETIEAYARAIRRPLRSPIDRLLQRPDQNYGV